MIKKITRKVINTFKKKPEQYLLHDEFWVQRVKTETIVDRVPLRGDDLA